MKKYYWVLFKITKCGWDAKGISTGRNEFNVQELSDTHPIQLQLDRNQEYGVEFDNSPPAGHKSREKYELLNWKEVTEEEYTQFKDHV